MFTPIQFGKYVLTNKIAVGGMAEIFEAKLYGVSGFEKPMVVKQILPQYAGDADFIKMFINEAKIAVSLSHGNIVAIYELGRIEQTYFIAMEFVSGRDLAQVLEAAQQQKAPFSVEHALFVTIEILKGLDYAHRRTDEFGKPAGVIHRDISPGNIMVSLSGDVKIADFGIAKVGRRLDETVAGIVKGTYGYMSPEQVSGLNVDHRTDIFGAGILLHEMLTGRRLFPAEDIVTATQQLKQAAPPPPSQFNANVSAELDSSCAQSTRESPRTAF